MSTGKEVTGRPDVREGWARWFKTPRLNNETKCPYRHLKLFSCKPLSTVAAYDPVIIRSCIRKER